LEEKTSFPEMLEGRVKTLQPEVFAGILAKRNDLHMKQLSAHGIDTIDMVVCNFYPMIHKGHASIEELVEHIDIGGPSMVRAASKNFEAVVVVPSRRFYASLAKEMQSNKGRVSLATSRILAEASWAVIAAYDIAINEEFKRITGSSETFPSRIFLSGELVQETKYGENPDQKGAVYRIDGDDGMWGWEQLFGESLSFNNRLDIGRSFEILDGFEEFPTACTVKHGQISGLAMAPTLGESYQLAHSCDPEADFGSTVVFNKPIDRETAGLVGKNEGKEDKSVYTEVVIAPGFDQDALATLKAKQKRKMQIIKVGKRSTLPFDIRILQGSLLVQEPPNYSNRIASDRLKVVTKKEASSDTVLKLLFSWEIVRRVESNGIVIGDGRTEGDRLTHYWTYGVASFRKRSGAVKIALDNAGERARGAVAASDGFFPFRDNIDLLARSGIDAVVQPGGSINDSKVIEAANEHGIVMAFTDKRAFRH
ncbi:MAG: bifunctional phosphoribosylaminoimidazolecarboxamide formyltransferase/IMP cyclohydrolase, partial [Nitrososphaerales archaeon]